MCGDTHTSCKLVSYKESVLWVVGINKKYNPLQCLYYLQIFVNNHAFYKKRLSALNPEISYQRDLSTQINYVNPRQKPS